MAERDPEQQQPSPEKNSKANEKRVIGLEEAGANFGIEDTYNAPEEIEAQRRNRKEPEQVESTGSKQR